MTAILESILTTVQSQIQELDLTDIPDASVYIQKVASTRGFESDDFPAVLIAPLGQPRLNPLKGTNLRDQIEYPVGVFILDNDNQNQTSDRDKYLTWYETILKKFRTPRLTGVDSVVNSYVSPGAVVDPNWFETGEYLAGMTLWFISWEAR
ncbi:hypothetical protein [Gimesia sp.]|uniref:hypothetical protein n=1 Tax=Gimesia sp. TaxID=2024833 RepID=UPI003A951338